MWKFKALSSIHPIHGARTKYAFFTVQSRPVFAWSQRHKPESTHQQICTVSYYRHRCVTKKVEGFP